MKLSRRLFSCIVSFLLLFHLNLLLTLLLYGCVCFVFYSPIRNGVGQHRVARYGRWDDTATGDGIGGWRERPCTAFCNQRTGSAVHIVHVIAVNAAESAA